MKGPLLRLTAALVAAAVSSAAAGAASNAVAPGSPQSIASAKHGFDLADLDTSCKACDDFYQFANGSWLARNPVPPDRGRYGHFNTLFDGNQAVLKTILEADAASAASAPPGSAKQKVGDAYAACMNVDAVNAAGTKALTPLFTAIDATNDRASLVRTVALLHDAGVGAFFNAGAGQDAKDPNSVIVQMSQGGLGMPDRDYYLADDPRSTAIRAAYAPHLAKMFVLNGESQSAADADAQAVVALETALAKQQRPRAELRDRDKNYNKFANVAALQALAPGFDFATYFKDRAYPSIPAININVPSYLTAVDSTIASTPMPAIRAYLRSRTLQAFANAMPIAFVDEDFAFYGKTIGGIPEQQPRWKHCAQGVDATLGEALGAEYVAKTFTPEAKARARQMVENLRSALRSDIGTLDWMSAPTKQQAIAKLDAFVAKIGYPDRWRTYDFPVNRTDLLGTSLAAVRFQIRDTIDRVGKAPDRTRWGMTPPTVNAYYNSVNNEIVFPAGILQPPFYDPNADDAVNYGGIGAVIGHEMTHGFDDQGRKSDGNGVQRDWWTPADAAAYDAKAKCVEDQFAGYEVAPGVHENGKLVLGESIADLGGITIAYKAFEKTAEFKNAQSKIDGFTPQQRFFLGWARIWGSNTRPETAVNQAKTDPHPYDKFRANGPLSNLPEFQAAFSCAATDAMVRKQRCRIW